MPQRARILVAAIVTTLSIFCEHAVAEDRVALVIGNSNYQSAPPLLTPATDAKAFADLLTEANFQVVWGADVAQIDMRRAIRDFSATVVAKGPDTVALIFYAGYGVQVDGENFLIPVNARIERESDVAVEALRLTDIINAISTPPSKARIVIIDAAHGNPFAQFNQTSGRGLAMIDAPAATLVAYSAAPGTEGANRPFTATLINAAKIPGISIDAAFGLVRIAMFEASNGAQLSWETSKLTTGFSLFPGSQPAVAPDLRIKPAEIWRREIQSRPQTDALRFILSQDATAGYEEFLRIYPQTPFAPQLRSFLNRRQEMLAWQNALKTNSIASYEGFAGKYPSSDLTPNAQGLLKRARANFQTGGSTPAAVTAAQPPATLPVAPSEPAAKNKRAASDDDDERPRKRKKAEVRHRERVRAGEPSPQVGPPAAVGIGIGGIGLGGIGIGLGRPH